MPSWSGGGEVSHGALGAVVRGRKAGQRVPRRGGETGLGLDRVSPPGNERVGDDLSLLVPKVGLAERRDFQAAEPGAARWSFPTHRPSSAIHASRSSASVHFLEFRSMVSPGFSREMAFSKRRRCFCQVSPR